MSLVEVKKRQIETFAYMVECISLLIFGHMMNNVGIAYVAIAMECIAFVGLLLGTNGNLVIGRMLRSKSSKGQYKNALRIRNVLLLFQVLLGIIGTALVILGSQVLAEKWLGVPNATFIVMILAPTILIRMLIAVLLGSFQGEGSEFPSVAYAILRQIGIIVFGIIFCKIFMAYGHKVSALLGQEVYTYVYGGMGIALAFLVTEVVLLIGLGVVSFSKGRSRRQKADEGMRTTDSARTIVVNYISNRMQYLLMYALLYLPIISGLFLYAKKRADAEVIAVGYGNFVGIYMIPCALVILFLSLMIIPMYGRIVSLMRKEEIRHARNAFSAGVHIVIVNGLFATVFIACMSDSIVNWLLGRANQSASYMMKVGAVFVLLAVFVIFFFGLMRAWGKEKPIIVCASLANVVYLLLAAITLNAVNADVMALVYSGLGAALVLSVGLGYFVYKHIRVGIEVATQIAIPAAAACVTGLICIFLEKMLAPHIGSFVTVMVCLIISLGVYWVILLLLRSFREQEIKYIPGGRIIQMVGHAFHVF